MPSASAKATQIWMAATQQPIGLGVVVTDPLRAKVQLYGARKSRIAKGFPLGNWTIRTAPTDPACQLWLIRLPDNAEPEPS